MDPTRRPVPRAVRTRAAVAAVLTVAAGLGVRAALTGDLAKFAGDALYTVLLVWLVLVVAPRTRPVGAAVVALAISVAVELFQLTGVPAALSEHLLARLVLGSTFNAPDLPWYAVGALAGWGLAVLLVSRTSPSVALGRRGPPGMRPTAPALGAGASRSHRPAASPATARSATRAVIAASRSALSRRRSRAEGCVVSTTPGA